MARDPRPRHVTITRYQDAAGRRCARDAPGAVKVTERSRTYWANCKVGGRWTRVNLGTEDEGAAWAELRRLQRFEREREAGLTGPAVEHARRPLAGHVEDWRAVLTAAGISSKQVNTLCRDVLGLAALARPPWKRIGDITADSTVLALSRLRHEPGRGSARERGRSAQTGNHYLSHLRQFCRWLVAGGRLPVDPVAGVRPADVESDRRHHRRCPSDDEVARLFRHLEADLIPLRPAKTRKGMLPAQRALGYKVAMATGLRGGELRSLTRGSFDLDAAPATVTLSAAYDKRRRQVTQPLPDWLALELRAWFAGGGGCWAAFPEDWPGRLLRDDLAACGISYSVPGPAGDPLYFDFHALRHWYCTQVAAQPGMDLTTLLRLTRHSTPALALRRYAHADQRRADAAASRVPRPGGPSA